MQAVYGSAVGMAANGYRAINLGSSGWAVTHRAGTFTSTYIAALCGDEETAKRLASVWTEYDQLKKQLRPDSH
jgi:hypothetical protein